MWMKLPPTKAGACCLPRPSLSFAYGVSCRARAERDALRPFRPIRPWNLQRFLRFLRSHPPVRLGLGTCWRGSIEPALDDEESDRDRRRATAVNAHGCERGLAICEKPRSLSRERLLL